jgi:hypothetical protein
MATVDITAGRFSFVASFEEAAPRTVTWFRSRLPFRSRVIHARWSGEAVWIPLGDLESGLDFENHTRFPSRGDLLFYPGGISETELLFAYGSAAFASKMSELAGNHFLTVIEGAEQLTEFGTHVLWNGAQDISFTERD